MGPITDTGITVSGSVSCSPDPTPNQARVLNFLMEWTLNDGLFDTTQLLMTRTNDQVNLYSL